MGVPGPLSEAGLVRLLNHEGEPVPDERFNSYVAELTADDLRAMYRDMRLTRAFDIEATNLQRQGELALWVPVRGQEGAQIGSAWAMQEHDYVFPSYREHGVALVRGIDTNLIMGLFRGVEHAGWDPKDKNFHFYTLVIGAHTLHATGFAMARARDGYVGNADPAQNGAVVAYFGDGATAQGDVNESLTFAAVNQAPVVFFCQNNQFAISVSAARQSIVPFAQRADGFGVPNLRIDGNDVLASYAASKWALDHARSGRGPVFIEALTYRMGAHTTSDDPTRYREAAEEEYWQQRDPIVRLEAFLRAQGQVTDEYISAVENECRDLSVRTRNYVKGLDKGHNSAMFDHVYASEHKNLRAEKAWYARFERSFVPASGGAHD